MRTKYLETIIAICFGATLFLYIGIRKQITPLTGIEWLLPFIFLMLGIAIFSPYLSIKIHWLWMKIAQIMGAVMSKVLLAVIFYVFLLPFGLMWRATQKNPLQLKAEKNKSFYSIRNKKYAAEDLENPW